MAAIDEEGVKRSSPHGRRPPHNRGMPRPLPRALDVAIASAAILLTLPFLAAAVLAILLADGRPVLFSQERVGRGGRPFRLRKLRTMRAAGTPEEASLVTAAGDSRITPVGRLLRRFRLDELPNLWSVVAGELALVGPRPEVGRFVDLENPHWQRVLAVRPGLADPVTLRLLDEEALLAEAGGERETFYRNELLPWKLAASVEAIERRTPIGDLGVLFLTALSPFLRRDGLTLDELRRWAAARPGSGPIAGSGS